MRLGHQGRRARTVFVGWPYKRASGSNSAHFRTSTGSRGFIGAEREKYSQRFATCWAQHVITGGNSCEGNRHAPFIHVQTELYSIPRISTHTPHTHTTPYKITKVAPLHSLPVCAVRPNVFVSRVDGTRCDTVGTLPCPPDTSAVLCPASHSISVSSFPSCTALAAVG